MNFEKLIKFCNEWKWASILLAICLAGIPLTTIYGLRSVNWGNDFWPNALSEFLGMFVGLIFSALFTFVVIDKYLEYHKYHKNLQWKKIKNITYKNLYLIATNMLLKLNSSFPNGIRIDSYVLTEDQERLDDYLPEDDFNIFTNALSKNIDKITQETYSRLSIVVDESDSFVDEQIYSALVKFKQHSKSEINLLSSLIIPRLLYFSDDLFLLEYVIELEELFTSLMSKINVNGGNSDKNNNLKYNCLLEIQEIIKKIMIISNSLKDDITSD